MDGTPIDGDESAVAITSWPSRRVSWGAIWAGMFVTLLFEVMFVLLGVACGVVTFNPLHTMPSAPSGFSSGAAIWLIVSWLVSVWIGACVAGWMSGGPRRADGTVHGLVVWSFSCAILLLLTTGAAGALLGASGGLLSRSNNAALAGIAQQQTPQPSTALSPTGRTDAQEPQSSQPSESANGPSTSGLNGVRSQALWGFIVLILGLIVAAWGGSTGVASSDRSLAPA